MVPEYLACHHSTFRCIMEERRNPDWSLVSWTGECPSTPMAQTSKDQQIKFHLRSLRPVEAKILSALDVKEQELVLSFYGINHLSLRHS